MPVDKKVTERHIILDDLFRSSDGMTYAQLQKELGDKGIIVTTRTIQKDIAFFKSNYGASFKYGLRKSHSALVRYTDTTKSLLDKGAIAEKILEISKEIKTNNDLYPHFVLASEIIQHLCAGNSIEGFYDAVDFGDNIDLKGIELFGDILRAIVNKQCITFTYKPYTKSPIPLTVSPYRLKQYNLRWFLICKTKGVDYYSFDALDRIEGNIAHSNAEYEEMDRTCLDGLYDTIGMKYALNDSIPAEDVVIKVKKGRYRYIESKPIHRSQELIEDKDDTLTLRLHVKVNPELVSSLLSFGDDVEVLEPLKLREDIRLIINNLGSTLNNSAK